MFVKFKLEKRLNRLKYLYKSNMFGGILRHFQWFWGDQNHRGDPVGGGFSFLPVAVGPHRPHPTWGGSSSFSGVR